MPKQHQWNMKIEFQNAKATPVKHKDRMPECQNNTSEAWKKNARMTKQHQWNMTIECQNDKTTINKIAQEKYKI